MRKKGCTKATLLVERGRVPRQATLANVETLGSARHERRKSPGAADESRLRRRVSLNVLVEALEKAPKGAGGFSAPTAPLEVLRQKALLLRRGFAIECLRNEELCLVVTDVLGTHGGVVVVGSLPSVAIRQTDRQRAREAPPRPRAQALKTGESRQRCRERVPWRTNTTF